jgi:hypothetical protein
LGGKYSDGRGFEIGGFEIGGFEIAESQLRNVARKYDKSDILYDIYNIIIY